MRDEPGPEPSFEQMGERAQPGLLAEFFSFLRENKKWWLLPILLMMGLLGLVILLSSTAAAPFIYTLF